MNKVKTKIALNMTKRQLVCFSLAAAVGVPTYIFSRGAIGNEGAVLLMMGVMLPFFFTAMYEKDGQPAEKILRNFIRARMFFPGKRPYKTENLYSVIEREGKNFVNENKAAGAAGKTPDRRGAKSKKRKKRT